MPRVVIGDLLTGRRILELPYVSYRWELRRNAPESLSAVTALVDPDVRALQLRNTATPGKTVLGIVEDAGGVEWMPGAGPMNNPGYDRDTQRLTFDAAGVWSYFAGRSVLPIAALTVTESQFLIPDPSDATKTLPNPALATQFDGLEYGTIVKRLVQQALSWPSSALPIRFEDDRAGVHTSQRYEGVDFKRVADAIADITKYIDGPDVRFDARYQADRLGIEWLLRTGN